MCDVWLCLCVMYTCTHIGWHTHRCMQCMYVFTNVYYIHAQRSSLDVYGIYTTLWRTFFPTILCVAPIYTYFYTHTNKIGPERNARAMNEISFSLSSFLRVWVTMCLCVCVTMCANRIIRTIWTYGGQSVGFCREACASRYRPRWYVFAHTHDMTLSNTEHTEEKKKNLHT